jgi:3-deoxy-manno-octulosonate cytidylyltransferase (CMP-KDO synthetase)
MFSVIIPARYGSSRLPGKVLADIGGRPMLQHVYEHALASGASSVVVATDDERVKAAAAGFGARVCMTSAAHRSGTDRLAEAAAQLGEPEERIVVNLQGDEPLLPATLVRQVAEDLDGHPEADIATLCRRVASRDELFDPHAVKVVMDGDGFALYFSRAPIPWHRDEFMSAAASLPADSLHFRHLGLYAYRVSYLRYFASHPPCALELAESLEQLRALHGGHRIHVAEALEAPGHGVDTPADLVKVRRAVAVGG